MVLFAFRWFWQCFFMCLIVFSLFIVFFRFVFPGFSLFGVVLMVFIKPGRREHKQHLAIYHGIPLLVGCLIFLRTSEISQPSNVLGFS